MTKQPGAEFDVDPVGGVGEHIGAQYSENGLEQRNRDKSDHEHVERAEAAVHQHLVDHNLEEQRRDQRKKLEKERPHQHAGESVTIFVNGAEEPADVKAPRQIKQPRAPRHQHELTVPQRLEFVALHQARSRLRR